MSTLKTRRLTVRLPADLLDQLAYRAAVEALPLSAILRADLEQANAAWRPPAPTASGLTIVWPEDRVSDPCVTAPAVTHDVIHPQPVEPAPLTPDTASVCQAPLRERG